MPPDLVADPDHRVERGDRTLDSDRTYGLLGTVVAERAIGVDGPIREYYQVPFTEPDPDRHRTEICWPVFQTA